MLLKLSFIFVVINFTSVVVNGAKRSVCFNNIQESIYKPNELINTCSSICQININRDLADRQPLLIHPGTSKFFYPNDNAVINMENNEEMELFCSQGFASPSGLGQNLITIKCSPGNRFTVNGIAYYFKQFNCQSFVDHTTIRTGIPCYNGSTIVDIGFNVQGRFLKTMSICHNKQTEQNYYAKYQLFPQSVSFQRAFPRPAFIQSDFFLGKDINELYTRATQRSTVANIISSDTLSWKWIERTGDIFLARGHLAAKSDFIYGNQQRSTFYFINASPQWQTFNGLNWLAVEDGSRRLAADRGINLDVYTGTHGIITLKDDDGFGQEIFLDIDNKKVPVPKIFYKVLINRAAKSGIVLIGVNNPHLKLKEIKKDYIICTDISNVVNYINWNRKDIRRGYSYACEVNEFLRTVPHIPDVDVGKKNPNILSSDSVIACTINVNKDIHEPQPLLLQPGLSKIFYPTDKRGIVELEIGQEIELVCTKGFLSPAVAETSINVKCAADNKFTVNNVAYSFNEFYCTNYPVSIPRKTGNSCYNGAAEIEIGFDLTTRFIRTILACHDLVKEETHYVKYVLTPANDGFQSGFPRPAFITGGFFNNKNVDALYSRAIQRETIAGLIGSYELAQTYVEATSDIFLARGHLAAKADFIYGNEQRSTFFFLNTCPQWQRFNAINWVAVEDGSRILAAARNINLDVYTGSFGVMGLKDVSQKLVDIFLYVNGNIRQIPVPKIYYKLLHDKENDSGIVLIGVNNPHVTLEEIKKDYIVCTDVSDKITYIKWYKDDIKKGFSYACEINDFLKNVPHISPLNPIMININIYILIKAYAGCTINVNGGLGEPQPLLIRPGTSNFYYPAGKDGIINLNENGQIEIFCSSGFATPSGVANSATATCASGNQFIVNNVRYSFNQFACKNFVESTARKTGGRCYNNGFEVEIGFVVSTRFLRTMTVCHDETREETYYAKYTMTPANEGYQTGYPRPNFVNGPFFGGKNVDGLYSRNTQRNTVATILGSSALAAKYIEETSDVFMARGHLAAKADFIFGSQQKATFFFVNVAPQWQKFNAINWAAAEDASRHLAANRNINLEIYSGTWGVTGLKDASNTFRDIYLYVSGTTRKIPVPKLYYKILLNKADNSGIVLIGVNNPHLTLEEIKKDYIICTDVSDKINYVNWLKNDLSRGFSYACDVNEFLKKVPHISGVSTGKLLV
ncbi:unnamed protein product [Diamesa tonsa]